MTDVSLGTAKYRVRDTYDNLLAINIHPEVARNITGDMAKAIAAQFRGETSLDTVYCKSGGCSGTSLAWWDEDNEQWVCIYCGTRMNINVDAAPIKFADGASWDTLGTILMQSRGAYPLSSDKGGWAYDIELTDGTVLSGQHVDESDHHMTLRLFDKGANYYTEDQVVIHLGQIRTLTIV